MIAVIDPQSRTAAAAHYGGDRSERHRQSRSTVRKRSVLSGSRRRDQRESGSQWTHRWREMDSNLQYRAVKRGFVSERKRLQPATIENGLTSEPAPCCLRVSEFQRLHPADCKGIAYFARPLCRVTSSKPPAPHAVAYSNYLLNEPGILPYDNRSATCRLGGPPAPALSSSKARCARVDPRQVSATAEGLSSLASMGPPLCRTCMAACTAGRRRLSSQSQSAAVGPRPRAVSR
jgi:hypothetical protein